MNKTLNDQQRKLVEDNHNLIYYFLKGKNLSLDAVEDWYGLCAIGLCKAALIYDSTKGTQFTTLAWVCMQNSCHKDRLKAYQKSLQDVTNIVDMNAFNEVCPDLSYDPYIDKEFKIFVEEILTHYQETTRQMIRLKLYNDITFEEIGRRCNCTKQNAQIKWKSFCKRVKKELNL